MFTEYELGPQVCEKRNDIQTEMTVSALVEGAGAKEALPVSELAAAFPLGMQCFVVSWLSMRASRSASRVALASR